MEIISLKKTCTKCGEHKPATNEFFTMSNGKLVASCKICVAAYYRAYYAGNSQKERARMADYYATNRDKHIASARASNAKHPETLRRRSRNRRARENNALSENYTTQQILDMYGTICHICLLDINLTAPRKVGIEGWELGLHLDHVIPLSCGGSNLMENIKPSHGLCNMQKGANEMPFDRRRA